MDIIPPRHSARYFLLKTILVLDDLILWKYILSCIIYLIYIIYFVIHDFKWPDVKGNISRKIPGIYIPRKVLGYFG